MLFYFLLATSYIQIKQKCKFEKLYQLSSRIMEEKIAKNIKSNQNLNYWIQCREINGQILQIFAEIRAQNSFWSKYLTIYFSVYIMEICYFSYCLFFNSASNVLQRLFFAFFATEFLLIILYVTLECSKIVNTNCAMHRKSQRICLQLQLLYRFKITHLLKTDLMAMNYRNIASISFKLLNNYKINSKMFQMLFSYISLFFIMIVRQNQQN